MEEDVSIPAEKRKKAKEIIRRLFEEAAIETSFREDDELGHSDSEPKFTGDRYDPMTREEYRDYWLLRQRAEKSGMSIDVGD